MKCSVARPCDVPAEEGRGKGEESYLLEGSVPQSVLSGDSLAVALRLMPALLRWLRLMLTLCHRLAFPADSSDH